MFEIKGNIEFDPINVSKKHFAQSSWKRVAVVKFDCDTYSYYSWFIERRFDLKLYKPIRGTHITIINDKVENEIYDQAIELFDGKELTFLYDPTCIRSNGKHWWLKVYCDDARNIRSAMGLTPDPYFGLHMTIGNANEKNIEYSKYIIDVCKRHNL